MSNHGKNKQDDTGFWFLAIIFMVLGLTPIGLGMIFWKLFLQKDKKTQSTPLSGSAQEQTPLGSRTTTGAGAAAMKTNSNASNVLKKLNKKNKSRVSLAGILTAVFALSLIFNAGDSLTWLSEDPLIFLNSILVPLSCTLGSAAFLWSGLSRRKQLHRFRSYLAMIGNRSHISISALCNATDRSPGKVREDLSDMLDLGLFPLGYLDYGGDRLVLSGSGVSEPKPTQKSAPKKQDENAVLSEIRTVNDAIKNEKLSAQIDRIGQITAKILDYQTAHPEKAPALHSFLSYYLPTTLKILRAYAQLEAQDVKGANITASMERIEGMMDKVVEGFEKQLDQLFLGDSMDIASDVEVLERMLQKDGLSGTGSTLQL